MKRIALIYLIIISSIIARGQGFEDALRFSQNYVGGTARYTSMGGAFGALGGDVSALSVNPAGIAVYQKGVFTFSPAFNRNISKTRYYGTNRKEFDNNFSVDNLGVVTAIKSKNKQLINYNFGIGFNRIADFNTYRIFEGINPGSSLVDFFLEQARGNSPYNLNPYVEGLAYRGYVIDLDTNSVAGTDYITYMPPADETYQKRIAEINGRINEWTLAFGANYAHTLYVGAAVGLQSVFYDESFNHSESDFVYNNQLLFDYYRYNTYTGKGYNFKFGFIFKPIQLVRIGGAIHTPTVMKIDHEYDASLYSVFASPSDVYPADANGNYYDTGLGDYKLITPLKAIASIGLQLKSVALLSFDYEYIDYSQIRYRESNDLNDMDNVNMLLNDYLKPAGNIKAGAEIKLGNVSFRGGYTLYGSPYGKNDFNSDAKHYSVSCGLGFRVNAFFFDLAYRYTVIDELLRAYDYYDSFVDTDYRISKVIATIGFRL
jgi:hypothetical protein